MAPVLAALHLLFALQSSGGWVTGTVRSAGSNELLANAIVELTDIGRATATDENGRYTFRDVPAGPQHIVVRFIGHEPRTLHALVPAEGRLEINVTLVRRPILLPSMEVRSLVALRGLEGDSTSYPDREVSIGAVRDDPRLAEPDGFMALSGAEIVLDPESPSGVHIRGGSSDQTGYLLDGIPVFNPYHAAGVFSAWNPDALSRLELTATDHSSSTPDALSGTIAATTLTPGDHLQAQGSITNTQARVTINGPAMGGGYLLSLRSGAPGIAPRKSESSYLDGTSGDWLAKLEAPMLGGRLRLLGYGSQDEINAAAGTSAQPHPGLVRNIFAWDSRSFGVGWLRSVSAFTIRLLGWHAESGAESHWESGSGPIVMASDRRDLGLLAQVDHRSPVARTSWGIRLERSHTTYDIRADSADEPLVHLPTQTLIATAFADQTRTLGARFELGLGSGATLSGTAFRLSPHLRIRWMPTEAITLSASYSRQHQFSQSLRNNESVVGNVFPADFFIGAGAYGIPIARSDLGVLAVDYRPRGGMRFGVQAYDRYSSGLVLVAPREGEPFTLGNFATGSASARGLSVTAAFATAHLGVQGSYALQQVHYQEGSRAYVPIHGATHLLEAGMIVFPTATTSIKLGATGALGRRTTIIANGFEWEACNIRDQGCEFSGSPSYGGEHLGGTTLPGYFRVDLGARKHWHLDLGGRHTMIALFASMTNLMGRTNILTYARAPNQEMAAIEMRPRSPLVIGIDWSF